MNFSRKMIPSIILAVLGAGLLAVGLLVPNSSTVTCGHDVMTSGDQCAEAANGESRVLSYTQREDEIKQSDKRFHLTMLGGGGLLLLVAIGSVFAVQRSDKTADEAADKASDWQDA